jgi:hypothetical protein
LSICEDIAVVSKETDSFLQASRLFAFSVRDEKTTIRVIRNFIINKLDI